MIAVDSSVVVAACASWHESHAAAQEALDEDPRLVGHVEERGVFGEAVYDGLVAMSARAHGLELASLDRRAVQTYGRCGARFRLLEAR